MVFARPIFVLWVLFVLGNVVFAIYEMAEFSSYSAYDDYYSFSSARDSTHWTIAIVSAISYFLMGCVFLAAIFVLPTWWRKALVGWGMFTCLVMFVAGFF